MIRAASPRLGSYAALAALGLLAGLAFGRAELVALAAPFALFVLLGLASSTEPRLRFFFALAADRLVEGEETEAALSVTAAAPVERLDLMLPVSPHLELTPAPAPVAIRLVRGQTRTFPVRVRCARWGAYAPGEVVVRAYDRFGLVYHEGTVDCGVPLRVYPTRDQLHAVVRPRETQVFAGDEVARVKGDGIEFADIRPFAYGDQIRRINWRASARQQKLFVTERHPERNADIVLFLDGFSEVRRGGQGTLDTTVRAAASLADAYLSRRDRVGVITFGGRVSWLLPSMGDRQIYRIVESLLDTEIAQSHVWRRIDLLPPRTLPPRALVIAFSPLTDWRLTEALLDLRGRGFDLAVVEISPLPYADRGSDDPERLAYRLWLLWREAVRFRFARSGVPVVEWREDVPLATVLEEVIAYRRSARPA
ncbi:MAG TPA: DUF58 domain-containing protein [Gaiellaceae bacterium]|nr:DUF58 domain-containing protein [Gaiellaceae bacterium]